MAVQKTIRTPASYGRLDTASGWDCLVGFEMIIVHNCSPVTSGGILPTPKVTMCPVNSRLQVAFFVGTRPAMA